MNASTAEDEFVTLDTERDPSEGVGHNFPTVENSEEVPYTTCSEKTDVATSDAISLGEDGPLSRCKSRETINAFTSPVVVRIEDLDTACGSGSGVDDHSSKLSKGITSTVYPCV